MRPSTFGRAMRVVSCKAGDAWPWAKLGRTRNIKQSARPFLISFSLAPSDFQFGLTALLPRFSARRLENQYSRVAVSDFRSGNKQAAKRGYPDRRRRAWCTGKLQHRRVVVGILLLIDSEAIRAGRVNALARGVVPKVVDTGDAIELGNLLAGHRVENDQLRRIASTGEKAMVAFIQCQCGDDMGERPGRDSLAFFAVDDSDLACSGEGDKNSRPRCLDFDAARLGIGLDVAYVPACLGIDDRQGPGRSIAESDVKEFRGGRAADVIRIWPQRHAGNQVENVAAGNPVGAVVPLCDIQTLAVPGIRHDRMLTLACN